MTIPSQARLIEAFGEDQGTAAYRLAKRLDDCRQHPAVVKWAEQCYHDPRDSSDAHSACLMEALNAVLEGCGVEAIEGRYIDHYNQNIQATYVNFGEAYATTLLYDHETDRLRLTSLGDFVERFGEAREIQ